MTKDSLLDELKDEKQTDQRSRKGTVAVLSRKDAIKEALEHGYTLKAVFSILTKKGEMPISYESFCRLVKKYITKPISNEVKTSKIEGKQKKSHIFDPDNYSDIENELK